VAWRIDRKSLGDGRAFKAIANRGKAFSSAHAFGDGLGEGAHAVFFFAGAPGSLNLAFNVFKRFERGVLDFINGEQEKPFAVANLNRIGVFAFGKIKGCLKRFSGDTVENSAAGGLAKPVNGAKLGQGRFILFCGFAQAGAKIALFFDGFELFIDELFRLLG